MFTSEIEHLEREVKKVTRPTICQELRDKSKSDRTPTNFLEQVRPKLFSLAEDIDYKMEVGDPFSVVDPWTAFMWKSEGSTLHGICDLEARKIVISPDQHEDMRTRCMVHELTHAIGANSLHSGNDEIAAEATAWLVCKQLGYDSFDWSMPQVAVAHWTMDGKFNYDDITRYTNRILQAVGGS